MRMCTPSFWDTPENLGNGKLQPKICRAVLRFRQVRFHSFSDLSEFVGSCRELSGVVGTCREFVGTCWDLSGVVEHT